MGRSCCAFAKNTLSESDRFQVVASYVKLEGLSGRLSLVESPNNDELENAANDVLRLIDTRWKESATFSEASFKSWAEYSAYSELGFVALDRQNLQGALKYFNTAKEIVLSDCDANDLAIYDIEASIQEAKLKLNAEDASIEIAVGMCMLWAKRRKELYGTAPSYSGVIDELRIAKVMMTDPNHFYFKQGLIRLGNAYLMVCQDFGKRHRKLDYISQLLVQNLSEVNSLLYILDSANEAKPLLSAMYDAANALHGPDHESVRTVKRMMAHVYVRKAARDAMVWLVGNLWKGIQFGWALYLLPSVIKLIL